MDFEVLDKNNLEEVMDLFCKCFFEDTYYVQIFKEPSTRTQEMKNTFSPVVDYCLENGYCIGLYGNLLQ